MTEVACGEYGDNCVDRLLVATEALLPVNGLSDKESHTATSMDDDKTEDSSCTTSLLKERVLNLRLKISEVYYKKFITLLVMYF